MKIEKVWDSLALFFILLLSISALLAVIQLFIGENILTGYSHLINQVLTVLFAITVTLITIVLVMENGSPVRTLAWIMVMVFVPVIGFIFYLFFGRNWRKNRIFSQKGIEDILALQEHILLTQDKLEDVGVCEHSPLSCKLASLLNNNNKALLTLHNRVKILPETVEAFDAILAGIAQAKSFIHVVYFALHDDETGRAFKDALIARAREGITIRLIYDAVGCRALPGRYKQELRHAGVQMYPFLPAPFPFLSSKLNYRNHRKFVLVDNKIAYMGGLNIGDKYMSKNSYFGYWRDSVVILEGESVLSLQAIYLTDWYFVSRQNLLMQKNQDGVALLDYEHTHYRTGAHDTPVQIVTSGPDSDWESIMQVYFAAIANAQKSVHITSPYLILNESLLMALKTVALSGVEVKIVLPHKPDHLIVFWGSRSYYTELMQAGVEIYEYTKGFVHAKVLIIDGEIVSIGTANMDMRSFNHNFELNAMLYDREAARIADEQFAEDITNSMKMIPEVFAHRSDFEKIRESLSRLFSPLL